MRIPPPSRSSIAARLSPWRTCAAPTRRPSREDDHVRGDGPGGRLLRRPELPALRGRAPRGACETGSHPPARRLSPPRAQGAPSARARARPRRGGGRRAGRLLGVRRRDVNARPGPARGPASVEPRARAGAGRRALRRRPAQRCGGRPRCSATSGGRTGAPAKPAHRRSSTSRFRCHAQGCARPRGRRESVLLAPAAHAAGRCGDHPWCDTSLIARRARRAAARTR